MADSTCGESSMQAEATIMKSSSIYGAFNARWLSPEDVARAFVPTAHFHALTHFQNSLLMGPRGCGKTTLLKMLTRPAQRVWTQERLPKDPSLSQYRSPDFEAIYIPSDIRWSYELSAVTRELEGNEVLAERTQRAQVSISALLEAIRAFRYILEERQEDAESFVKTLLKHFSLGPVVPSFAELRFRLLALGDEIRSAIVRADAAKLQNIFDGVAPSFTGHALDSVMRACNVFEEYVKMPNQKWALCFDELEIAPTWLQSELLKALRSFDQHFLLKLTWSPILPTDLFVGQERQHDFEAIRMWHSHASDARPFCREFAKRFVQERFSRTDITPRAVLGQSPFAMEEGSGAYATGSDIWRTMVDLSKADPGFRAYLKEHGIDPDNPVSESVALRDETLRKVKPLVVLRDAYLKEHTEGGKRVSRRSRKFSTTYYGEDAIYAMSEGNPRSLAGLLNELFDFESRSLFEEKRFVIRPETQARVLFGASQRMLTGIRTFPVSMQSRGLSLYRLIDKLGNFLKGELLGGTFNADPIGSFIVDENVGPDVMNEIAVGLTIGAFVSVGSSQSDIPVSVLGARIRLSHMLAPTYRLSFRNLRDIRLSTALRIYGSSQRLMFI